VHLDRPFRCRAGRDGAPDVEPHALGLEQPCRLPTHELVGRVAKVPRCGRVRQPNDTFAVDVENDVRCTFDKSVIARVLSVAQKALPSSRPVTSMICSRQPVEAAPARGDTMTSCSKGWSARVRSGSSSGCIAFVNNVEAPPVNAILMARSIAPTCEPEKISLIVFPATEADERPLAATNHAFHQVTVSLGPITMTPAAIPSSIERSFSAAAMKTYSGTAPPVRWISARSKSCNAVRDGKSIIIAI
jgi:hypothetical protein